MPCVIRQKRTTWAHSIPHEEANRRDAVVRAEARREAEEEVKAALAEKTAGLQAALDARDAELEATRRELTVARDHAASAQTAKLYMTPTHYRTPPQNTQLLETPEITRVNGADLEHFATIVAYAAGKRYAAARVEFDGLVASYVGGFVARE